ncbi:HSP20-like chaperone domain-containing protein [Rozella allomycis CSF55]|uniref:HSP20-like chaperone domain-containing protein n=1 Tax=Rozella allomycis (strain CSF55) TaxID=988480 RepID=A0A075B220_ROZAC|nr:HSP20-like chaperone domain-containing protein [Rozella allomycis CSF55]|eukprot:EPZ36425.1 HSP20-like chaperone domain-containing protein [Rozella allomycis CSF55]
MSPSRLLTPPEYGSGQLMPRQVPTLGLGTSGIRLDISETPDKVLLKADMPGIKKEDIKVSTDEENKTLSIEAERKYEKEHEDEERKIFERHFGKMQRTVHVPLADFNKGCEAKFENGVLCVCFPKAERAAKGKAVTIS